MGAYMRRMGLAWQGLKNFWAYNFSGTRNMRRLYLNWKGFGRDLGFEI
jgi:hypothetical protein